LKTVDQYFYGLNQTIQEAHVEKILDSVLMALSNDDGKHERTFTYVETKFLYMWYEKLDETKRRALKDLVASKQFTFTNGGWCMHDEAPTHFSKCNLMTSKLVANGLHPLEAEVHDALI